MIHQKCNRNDQLAFCERIKRERSKMETPSSTITTEAPPHGNPNPSNEETSILINPQNPNTIIISSWPTIDGPLGLSEQDSLPHARKFFTFGFFLLPLLWAVNCYYFWPVLRRSTSFPLIRPYVVGSAIGFSVFSALLLSWALTFSIGGERLFGHTWHELVMYNVADRYDLTGWM